MMVVPFGVKYIQQMFLGKELWDLYCYNSITVLAGSVGLFLLFLQKEKRSFKLWDILGKTTFGVFLIHTQYIFRDKILWNEIFEPSIYAQESTAVFLVHFIVSVVMIFAVCSIVDLFRQKLFYIIKKSILRIRK